MVRAQGDRVVKHFDFDETKRGNFESIPMLWERHCGRGFPEYAKGRFDFQIGYDSPPSFYLQLDGRSCAYHYTGLHIEVEPDSDHRIEARIRPDRLKHARAYVSAFLLDANGLRIDGTERWSRLVGGDPQSQEWEEVSVRIPGNVDAAYSIGLSVWVVQRSHWWWGEQTIKHIDHKDVQGGAWFDDIVVYRLPSIELSSTASDRGNLYTAHEQPVLQVRVGDPNQHGLQADLIVRDASGRIVHGERIGVAGQQERTLQRIELHDLPPGAYYAHLRVEIEEGASIDRYLTFVTLSPDLEDLGRFRSRYGVVIEPESAKNWQAHSGLLHSLGVRNAKLALASEQFKDAEGVDAEFDAFVEQLVQANVLLTGTFVESTVADRDAASTRSQSLIDLLSKPTDTWRPYVANAVTQYESQFQHWQVGPDGNAEVFEDARLGPVLVNLREEMSKLTTLPILVAPWSIQHELGDSVLPANILSVWVPAETPPSEIPGYLDEQFLDLGYQQVWALLQVPPQGRYRRLPRLADFCKRLIYAQQSGANKIFVRQPWRSRAVSGKVVTEPDELFVVLRTVVSLLDDAVYIGELEIDEHITCHAFDRYGKAVLVMWDDHVPMGGRSYDLYLNGASRMADMWGNLRALSHGSDIASVTLSPLPVFIFSAETWLVHFRRELRFDPILLPSESTFHEQEVLVYNPRKEPISGSIKLKPPRGWQIRPAHFAFAVQPGQTFSQKVRIHSAPREPAGRKQIETQVIIDAAKLYEFDVQLPLKLDLSDMDVWVDMVIEGETVVLRHGITNRSNEVVTFTSFADAPSRKRKNLNIIGLQPNQTVVKSHYFLRADELSGKVIRVGLKQVKGPRSHNLTITVP